MDDPFDALLRPEDDRAWKLAVGHTLREVRSQTSRTNGRVTKLEMWRAAMAGALTVVTVGMPVLLWLIQEATK